MRLTREEHLALSHMADRWWGGPDDGDEVTVTLRFRTPSDRGDTEVLDLFGEILEPLSGGYRWRVAILNMPEETP